MKNKQISILIVKESREDEGRVALLPSDVKKLTAQGFKIYVEAGAGEMVNCLDCDYVSSGATIRPSPKNYHSDDLKELFYGIDVIARVKRPNREREIAENDILPSGIIMLGALDPKEKNSNHIAEYKDKKVHAYSIDQLDLEQDDPMNILSSMSALTGRLALNDAFSKHLRTPVKKIFIIGFGAIGKSVFKLAIEKKIKTLVLVTNKVSQKFVFSQGGIPILADKNLSVCEQRDNLVQNGLYDSDIMITSVRKNNAQSPILITKKMLDRVKEGAVIIDLALSEGGNVEGSRHDKIIKHDNGVIIVNVSGYPKSVPLEASKYWSQASRLCIEKLAFDPQKIAGALIE